MTDEYTPRQLTQAIEWFVRLQSDTASAEDQQGFARWLAKHQNHPLAYAAAEKIWADMGDLKALPLPALALARAAKPRKTKLARLAVLGLAVGLSWGACLEMTAPTIDYATPKGGYLRVELADHTTLELNTDTRVSVRLSLLQRQVWLSQGEAMFAVSHSYLRPFTVQVQELSLRDVGTRFNVRKLTGVTTVSVLEGVVAANNGQQLLNAGQQLEYRTDAGLGQVQNVEDLPVAAWLQGQLVFKQTPLSTVAAELERYHAIKFSFADPKLAEETLSGTFNAHDLEPFLHALESIMPVSVKRKGQMVVVRRAGKG